MKIRPLQDTLAVIFGVLSAATSDFVTWSILTSICLALLLVDPAYFRAWAERTVGRS